MKKGDYINGKWIGELIPLKNGEIHIELQDDKIVTTCPYCNKKVEVIKLPKYNFAEERRNGNIVGGEEILGELSCGCKIHYGSVNSSSQGTVETILWKKDKAISFYDETENIDYKNAFENIHKNDFKGLAELYPLIINTVKKERDAQYEFVRFTTGNSYVEYVYPKTMNNEYVVTHSYGGDKAGMELLSSIDFSVLIEKIIKHEISVLELGEHVVEVNYITSGDLHTATDTDGNILM